MVEQSIYFALGCIITALAAMMFAPVFWRRALRLTRKRLQLQVPLSMQEILAERDQLRAQFAVERLRIEQALEQVRGAKAADMAEIGRRSMEATTLSDQLAVSRGVEQGQGARIGLLTREAAEAGAEAGALKLALDDALGHLDAWQQRAKASTVQADRLISEVEAHRTTEAGLKTRVMGLEMRLTDTERAAAARLKIVEDGLRNRLEIAMGQATRHETSALSLRRECDDAKARVRALELEFESARERDKAAQIQASLESRRGERAEPADGSPDDLRASIHALGLAVAMMSRRAGGQGETRPVRTEAPSPVDAG